MDGWINKKNINQQNDDTMIYDDRKHKVPRPIIMMVSFPGSL